MARIRSIKPELRTSLTVAEWPRDVRYAWVLLWGYLDDHGRGVDNVKLIAADLFPLDDDVTPAVMDQWLQLMANPSPDGDPGKPPPLCRYEVGGRRYLHATNWPEHQRPSHPTPSRIPLCPHHHAGETSGEPLAKSSGATPERLRPEQVGGAGSREQGAGGRPEVAAAAHPSTTHGDNLAPLGVPDPHAARCRKHQGHPDPPNCTRCRDARLAVEADLALRSARAAAAVEADLALRAAAKDAPWCGDCDPNGRWVSTPTGDKRCPTCNEVEILKRPTRPPLAVVGAR